MSYLLNIDKGSLVKSSGKVIINRRVTTRKKRNKTLKLKKNREEEVVDTNCSVFENSELKATVR